MYPHVNSYAEKSNHRISMSIMVGNMWQSRKISHMSKIFNFEILTPLSSNVIMLHFDANPIQNGLSRYRVMSNLINAENNVKQKNIYNMRFIPLDHVTLWNRSWKSHPNVNLFLRYLFFAGTFMNNFRRKNTFCKSFGEMTEVLFQHLQMAAVVGFH